MGIFLYFSLMIPLGLGAGGGLVSLSCFLSLCGSLVFPLAENFEGGRRML